MARLAATSTTRRERTPSASLNKLLGSLFTEPAELVVRGILPRPYGSDERTLAIGRVAGADERAAFRGGVDVSVPGENLRHGHFPIANIVVAKRERLGKVTVSQ